MGSLIECPLLRWESGQVAFLLSDITYTWCLGKYIIRDKILRGRMSPFSMLLRGSRPPGMNRGTKGAGNACWLPAPGAIGSGMGMACMTFGTPLMTRPRGGAGPFNPNLCARVWRSWACLRLCSPGLSRAVLGGVRSGPGSSILNRGGVPGVPWSAIPHRVTKLPLRACHNLSGLSPIWFSLLFYLAIEHEYHAPIHYRNRTCPDGF